jgi:hypothetical protein
MRIDPAIYAAIDDGALSADELLAGYAALQPAIERTALETAIAALVAQGFSEETARRAAAEHAPRLREERADRIASLQAQLECRATDAS